MSDPVCHGKKTNKHRTVRTLQEMSPVFCMLDQNFLFSILLDKAS